MVLVQEKFFSLGGYVDKIVLGSVLVLILGFFPQGLSGLATFERLKALGWPWPVLFLTGHGDVGMAVAAVKTPRVAAISGVTLGPGSTPPRPGLAPWDSLIEIALTEGSAAFSVNFSASKCPSGVRHPK